MKYLLFACIALIAFPASAQETFDWGKWFKSAEYKMSVGEINAGNAQSYIDSLGIYDSFLAEEYIVFCEIFLPGLPFNDSTGLLLDRCLTLISVHQSQQAWRRPDLGQRLSGAASRVVAVRQRWEKWRKKKHHRAGNVATGSNY